VAFAGLDATVLVATYNQLDTTRLTLRALFAQQTQYTYEVIVCDDGSDAATVGALRDVLESAPVPAHLAWQQDRGFRLAASRNNGIRLARGRIVIMLDGDLLPEADFVQCHVEAHVHDRVIAVGQRLWRDPSALPSLDNDMESLWELLRSEQTSSNRHTRFRQATEMLDRHYLWKLQPWMTCYGCNISVTKSDLIEFDESFTDWGNEDYDLFYGLTAVHGYEVSVIHAVTYEVEGKAKDWKQADYLAHLRSGFRFFDKWSASGLRPEFAVPRYNLDPETGLWQSTHMPVHGWASQDHAAYVETARRWLAENGSYPDSVAGA